MEVLLVVEAYPIVVAVAWVVASSVAASAFVVAVEQPSAVAAFAILVAGLASYPRKEGELIAWPWLLLASPLWIMLFGIFGIAPVVSRTSDLLPLLRNGLGFLGGAIAAYLFAQATLGDRQKRESES